MKWLLRDPRTIYVAKVFSWKILQNCLHFSFFILENCDNFHGSEPYSRVTMNFRQNFFGTPGTHFDALTVYFRAWTFKKKNKYKSACNSPAVEIQCLLCYIIFQFILVTSMETSFAVVIEFSFKYFILNK